MEILLCLAISFVNCLNFDCGSFKVILVFDICRFTMMHLDMSYVYLSCLQFFVLLNYLIMLISYRIVTHSHFKYHHSHTVIIFSPRIPDF